MPNRPSFFYQIILILAYIHQGRIPFVKGRVLHLVHLSELLNRCNPRQASTVQSIRQAPILLTLLGLLNQKELVQIDQDGWITSATLPLWLNQSTEIKIQSLINGSFLGIEEFLNQLNLNNAASYQHLEFIKQQLLFELEQNTKKSFRATFSSHNDDTWIISRLEECNRDVLFDLLQIGGWQSDHTLHIDQLTIATASLNGFGAFKIGKLIESATDYELNNHQFSQLVSWVESKDDVQILPIYLLRVKSAADLSQMLKSKTLNKHVLQQITPEHALVSSDLVSPLRTWLSKQNRVLNNSASASQESESNTLNRSAAEYAWLAMKTVDLLSLYLDLPIKPTSSIWDHLQSLVEPHRLGVLEMMAEKMKDDFVRVVRGTDVFQPAVGLVPEEHKKIIESAMEQDKLLQIQYQTLVDKAPHLRRVRPFRLEYRGELGYLHGYCYLVNDNRQFRLDRIKQVEIVSESG